MARATASGRRDRTSLSHSPLKQQDCGVEKSATTLMFGVTKVCYSAKFDVCEEPRPPDVANLEKVGEGWREIVLRRSNYTLIALCVESCRIHSWFPPRPASPSIQT